MTDPKTADQINSQVLGRFEKAALDCGHLMAEQIAESALRREFVLGHQLSSDAKMSSKKDGENSEIERLNSVALEIHAMVEYGNFKGAREMLRRNIALRLLVEKWRNEANDYGDGGPSPYPTPASDTLRQCAKELEEALK